MERSVTGQFRASEVWSWRLTSSLEEFEEGSCEVIEGVGVRGSKFVNHSSTPIAATLTPSSLSLEGSRKGKGIGRGVQGE